MKPRLVVETSQPFLLKLNAIAAQESMDTGAKVTRSDIVIKALLEKYPHLTEPKRNHQER